MSCFKPIDASLVAEQFIVSKRNITAFEREVEDILAEGFIPLTPPITHMASEGSTLLRQTFVKLKEVKKELL